MLSRKSAKLYKVKVESDLKANIEQYAKDNQVTTFVILMAAFLILMHKYSNEDDLLIGTTVVNRNTQPEQNMIGYFSNTLPLRIKLNDTMTITEFLLY